MNNNQEVDDGWDRINIYDGPEIFLQTLAEVDSIQGLLFAATFAQSEIINGGFRQFFSNSTGVLAPEAVRGFCEIGMPLLAGIIQRACALFNEPYPRDRAQRQHQLLSLSKEALNELNQSFFALIWTENGGFEVATQSFESSSYGHET